MSRIEKERFGRILESVRRPSSYLGTELNSSHKDPSKVKGSIALVFPDLYEIGMSHLGLKILYGIINAESDLAAERAFAPDEDFATAIRKEGAPLMSLESKKPLKEFDVVGFTIPYELSYTTILWILDLANISLRSDERKDDAPIVVGGGAGVYNPEPIASFFDVFALGDGEELTLLILREVLRSKNDGRKATLERLAKIPGLYVPSLFDVKYKPGGEIEKIFPVYDWIENPSRVTLPDLADSVFPVKMVVPFGKPVQDRLNVEIDRGCTQGCRFCQAGSTYRPARERSPEEVIRIFGEALKNTGYSDISLTSLSAGDYSKIDTLLAGLMDRYEGERVSVSLPSMRPASVTAQIVEQLGKSRRSGFTIAVEAGTTRLRNALNKKVTDEEIIDTASRLLLAGWRSLKLYFMIGLPTETGQDIEAIYALALRLDKLKIEKRRFNNITISVSNFVPKAHTAFQWTGQDTIENLRAKKEALFEMIRPNKRLKFKWSDAEASHLEAVFARGDRRLGSVLETAYKMGRRLDAWTERFDFGQWIQAFAKAGIDPSFYANRDFGDDETLPWEHIQTGLTKKYFLEELALARKGELTADCKLGKCLTCGIDPKTCFTPYESPQASTTPEKKRHTGERFKLRLAFRKVENAKFFSQLEVQSIFQRALRVVNAPLAYSEGYSPHPKISFGPALPVGVESEDEMLDLELTRWVDMELFIENINRALPDGFQFITARSIPLNEKSISSSIESSDFTLTVDESLDPDALLSAVTAFNNNQSVVVQRTPGGKNIDVRLLVDKIVFDKQTRALKYKTSIADKPAVRPNELISAILKDCESSVVRSVRKLKTHMKH
ncbi:FIG092679: Fe-S oxidoreductase [hydrothermal vent metagenome]|uniref:FIG092679: Fe-S oxidoreductase n=1 Tax=hydrothermal vent metagenome TaxID=652676 RepID=A0A3B1CNW7_9ZZZZ